MKGKEFIDTTKITEDDCEVCEAHTQAYKLMPPDHIECPHCKKQVSLEYCYKLDLNVVGETNTCDIEELKEENFRMLPTITCEHCKGYIALVPTPIVYNGNHDIYYSGGKAYMPTLDNNELRKIVREKLGKTFDQYTKRVRKEKDLGVENLLTWTSYDIEHIIAQILYEKGLKI